MNWHAIADHPVTHSFGWTLLHFTWQATIVAVGIAIVLQALKHSSSQFRYLVSFIGLLAIAVLPIATLSYQLADQYLVQSKRETIGFSNSIGLEQRPINSGLDLPIGDFPVAPADSALAASTGIQSGPVTGQFNPLGADLLRSGLPWLVGLWGGGVCLLSLRLLLGLRQIRGWRESAQEVTQKHILDQFEQLKKLVKVHVPVRLLEAADAVGPAVISWAKPAILVPTGMLTSMTASELESILAHELAHVYRHDYLANLLQALVETVLFYHPCVWWLSQRVRMERENCCDDMAIAICGNRVAYVRTLVRLEEIRCGNLQTSVAATGGSMVDRIRRIVESEPNRSASPWPAGVIALAAVGCAFLFAIAPSFAGASPNTVGRGKSPNANPSSQGVQQDISLTNKASTLVGPKATIEPSAALNQTPDNFASMTVTTSPAEQTPSRMDRTGVKVLQTHTYSRQRRESTGFISVNGSRVPIDAGVKHEGTIVYLTLFSDVVALDATTEKALWQIPSGKTNPQWKTISIVEWTEGGVKQIAVEFFAAKPKKQGQVYRYVSLKTGQDLEPPNQAKESNAQATKKSDGWGPPPAEGDLRIRLQAETAKVAAGKPVLVRLEIKNFGNKKQKYDPQSYSAFRVLKVANAEGKPDEFVGMTPQTSGADVEIGPGETHTLWEKEDASALYMLNPGAYSVVVAAPKWGGKKLPGSNTIVLIVQPGEQSPIKQLMANLKSSSPRVWRISHMGSGKVNEPMAIFLSREPTSLKRDAVSIQIWFTPESLPPEFQVGSGKNQQTLTRLDECPLGHMNVAAPPNAEKFWPDYIDAIRNAAKTAFPK